MKNLQEVEVKRGKEMVFPTKNSLAAKVRVQLEGILQDRLADSIDLAIQAKQAHWNVKGPSFIALHGLFDQIAEESEENSDLIAERIVQFGGIAEGTIQVVEARTSLPDYRLNLSTGKGHIEALSHALATYADLVRASISQADGFNDPATADIFTEISRRADKGLWLIEAHHQARE